MSLKELLPDVRSLSRFDKLRLIQYLAEELEQDERSLIEADQFYSIWSPHESFSAAAAMLEVLESDDSRS